ncbi:MAG: transglycosylase SLT domain-containing protein [Acidobacteriota bacterium]
MKTRSVLLLLAICAAACATTAPPPKPTPNVTQHSSDLRIALEDAYAKIVAHETTPVNAPNVDVEAAASMPIPDHRTVRGALSLFTREMRPSIQESLIRSAKYKPLIDKALDAEKLPRGLAYLPVIESAYLPTLTSRAGAHGIWQFMSETAREYGLRVDWWVDERADPERSTRAAAKYLKDLHRQFDDWPLALAAYNAGPNRVRRALDAQGATTFWELLEAAAVPKETRGYVPTFFATLMIASDPASYGFELGEADGLENPSHIEVEGPVSLRYVADVAGVDEATLRELNPALRRAVAPPGKWALRVPPTAAETLAARATTLRNDDASIAVCSYTLRPSDTIKRIARAIGTDVDTITAMNGRIRPGATIYLPVRARELGALLAQSEIYYAVRKGDTLFSVAKRHHLSVAELRDLNDLPKQHKLRPGERLRVTAPRAVAAGGM